MQGWISLKENGVWERKLQSLRNNEPNSGVSMKRNLRESVVQ